MTRAGIVVVAGLIVGVVAATMPAAAVAEPRHHHRARLGPDGSRHHDRHTPRHRHHSPRRFVTVYSPPPVVYYTYYTPPPVYYTYYTPPPVYYAPPVVYQAPPVYVSTPAVPRVVEYPTGRYELRGDGVATPYEWAWIPNPPAAPPAPVEPATVTPESTLAVVTSSGSREALRWTDEHGVTTWTDRLDNVPERYRARVQRLH